MIIVFEEKRKYAKIPPGVIRVFSIFIFRRWQHMVSRIKGITVEIGGDTSGLEKSLSAVNNSIKKT